MYVCSKEIFTKIKWKKRKKKKRAEQLAEGWNHQNYKKINDER